MGRCLRSSSSSQMEEKVMGLSPDPEESWCLLTAWTHWPAGMDGLRALPVFAGCFACRNAICCPSSCRWKRCVLGGGEGASHPCS